MKDRISEKSSLLIDNGQNEFINNRICNETLNYDLRKYMELSPTLRNILWEFDILPFRDDLISYYCAVFEAKPEHKIMSISKASKYENWFFNLVKKFLQDILIDKIFNLQDLIQLICPKSLIICKKIIDSQMDILNEFNQKRKKIGLLYHLHLKNENPSLIDSFKRIVESPENNLELEEIQLNDLDLKSKCIKYEAVFLILDKNLIKAFDESLDYNVLNKLDKVYRDFGRIMYHEFINYGKNFRFYPFLVDDINEDYVKGSNEFFKYPWLLREAEEHFQIHGNNLNRIDTSREKKKSFFKPIRICDMSEELSIEQSRNLNYFLKNFVSRSTN